MLSPVRIRACLVVLELGTCWEIGELAAIQSVFVQVAGVCHW